MPFKHRILASFYKPYNIYFRFISFIYKRNKSKLRVLVYHDISPDELSKFVRQLTWLKKSWNFITPEEFEQHKKGKLLLPGNNILLTFDDGFYSNYLVAKSVLNELNIKALFFIVSDFVSIKNIDESRKFIKEHLKVDFDFSEAPTSFRNMSWENALELIELGHTIGAHTKTHAKLSTLSMMDELTEEIINSANFLEFKLNTKIRNFAFTFGDKSSINQTSLNIAKKRFDFVFTSLRGNNVYVLNDKIVCRDTIKPTDPLNLLGMFLIGSVDFLYKNIVDRICLR